MNREKIEQIVGELLLFAPLILLSLILNIALSVSLSMITIFICKHKYDKEIGSELHLKSLHCVTVSYSIFLIIGLFLRGLSTVMPFMSNQPMAAIIASLGITWLSAWAGDKQCEYKKYKRENEILRYEKIERDRLKLYKGCPEETVIKLCEINNVGKRDQDLLLHYFAKKTKYVKIERIFNISTPSREINKIIKRYDL